MLFSARPAIQQAFENRLLPPHGLDLSIRASHFWDVGMGNANTLFEFYIMNSLSFNKVSGLLALL